MVMAPLSTTAETSHTAPRLGKTARLRDYAGLIPFALLLLLAVFGPMLAPQSATEVVGTPSSAPSGGTTGSAPIPTVSTCCPGRSPPSASTSPSRSGG